MILKYLKLQNIRSYVEENITFPKGAVLLSGDIGAGKSTILLAIEFALFGILRAELSGDALLRNGKNNGSVELCFEINGKDVIINRTLKRSKDSVKQESGFIVMDGRKTELTPVELKTKILELMGYPDELVTKSKSLIYRYTVYTPQEQMKNILFEDADGRLETLRKIFGVDKYQNIISNAEIISKKLKDMKKEESGKIFDLNDKILLREKIKKEISEKENIKKSAKERLDSEKTKVLEKKNRLADIENKREESTELQKKLSTIKAVIEQKDHALQKNESQLKNIALQHSELAKKMANLPKINLESAEKEYQEKEKSFFASSKEDSELRQQAAFIEKQKNSISKEIEEKISSLSKFAEKDSELGRLKQQISNKKSVEDNMISVDNEICELNSRLGELEAQRKNHSEIISKIKSIDVCPTCGQNVDAHYKNKVISESKQMLSHIETHLKDKSAKKSESAGKLKEYKEALQRIITSENLIAKLQAEKESLENVSAELEKKKKLLSVLENEHKASLEKLAKTDVKKAEEEFKKSKDVLKNAQITNQFSKDFERLASEKTRLEEENKQVFESLKLHKNEQINLINKLNEFADIDLIYKKLKSDFENASISERNAEIEYTKIDKEIEGFSNNLKNLESEVQTKEKIKEKLQAVDKKILWLEESFMNLMQTIEKKIMLKVHSEFNSIFQKWSSLLIEDEIMQLRLGESFEPIATQNGYDVDVYNLSGGEKTACALAYRLALNKVINDYMSTIRTKDLIILDEPTDGFSSEQLDKVRDVLSQLDIKQIILVSHEPKLESFVDNTIRIAKAGHSSRILT